MAEQTQQPEVKQQEMELETKPAPKVDESKQLIDTYSKKVKELDEQNKSLSKQLEDASKQKLVEKENYKELYEMEKRSHEEVKNKFTGFKEAWMKDKKLNVIRQEAIKAGIREEAIVDLDLVEHDVQIEATSLGNINVIGAGEYMNRLKATRPHWFKQAGAPNVNGGGSTDYAAPKEYSGAELVELEKKDPAKYKQVIKERIAARSKR